MIDHGFGVRLGPVDSTHGEMLRAWRNDPRVWATCRQNDLISDRDQRAWFEKQSVDPSIRMYLIYDVNKQPVGVCGLTSIDPWNRRAEFSLYIGPEHQGKGLARSALKTMFTHGFKTLNLHLIWGESFAGNKACELFKKIGMTMEGIRRDFYFRGGRYLDAHLFSVRADEWLRRSPDWCSDGPEIKPEPVTCATISEALRASGF